MDIENLHKYVSLSKLPNGILGTISGIPAFRISESLDLGYRWNVDPAFARLVLGSLSYDEIPYTVDVQESIEESIVDCLVTLHGFGVLNTEVDLPEDSYVNTHADLAMECMEVARKIDIPIMERVQLGKEIYNDLLREARGSVSKHSITDLIDHAKNNVSNGLKPYHGLENSAAAVLIRAMAKAKAGIPHTHQAHDEHLKELAGMKIEKGRPKGTTVTAIAAKKEKEVTDKKQSRASLGVWGGLGKL